MEDWVDPVRKDHALQVAGLLQRGTLRVDYQWHAWGGRAAWKTPLAEALYEGAHTVARVLLKARADPNADCAHFSRSGETIRVLSSFDCFSKRV